MNGGYYVGIYLKQKHCSDSMPACDFAEHQAAVLEIKSIGFAHILEPVHSKEILKYQKRFVQIRLIASVTVIKLMVKFLCNN